MQSCVSRVGESGGARRLFGVRGCACACAGGGHVSLSAFACLGSWLLFLYVYIRVLICGHHN